MNHSESVVRPLLNPPEPTPYASSLEHLADAIGRIGDLVAAHLARAPQQVSRRYSTIDRRELLARATVGGRAEVPSETSSLWALADRKLAWIRRREELTLAAGGVELPLVRLAGRFGLSQLEQDVLLMTAAPELDPRYEEDWSAIDREMTSPSVRTAIAMMSRGFEECISMRALFSRSAPLVRHSLLLVEAFHGASESDFLRLQLEVPRRIVSELLGTDALDETLMGFSRLRTSSVSLDRVVLPSATKEFVSSLIRNHDKYVEQRRAWGLDEVVTYGKGLTLLFSGPPGTGKTMLANAVANQVGKRIFSVDIAKLTESDRSLEANLDGVFREAKLLDAVLFFDECEQIFTSRRSGNHAMPLLLTRMEQFDGIAILATNMPEVLDEAMARRIVATIVFEAPTPLGREAIWRKHLPAKLPLAEDVDVEALSRDFELTGGLIKNAVLAALVHCVARDGDRLMMADLDHGARLQLRVDASGERRLVRPEVRLDELVLESEVRTQVERFIASARVRSTVLTDWGFGKVLRGGNALTALFAGPPGTGKSATAEAVATALERPMLRCSLSAVVSQYVGETTKNLDALFRAARDHRAVLVFDEADALFARRIAVQTSNDRLANAETAALLTQLERHDGVVVLTTNLECELDPAFHRRIGLCARFDEGDARRRAAIWKKLMPSDAPLAEDVNLGELAKAHELSPAGIRNALLAAAFQAASQGVGARLITQRMLRVAAQEQVVGRPARRTTAAEPEPS